MQTFYLVVVVVVVVSFIIWICFTGLTLICKYCIYESAN